MLPRVLKVFMCHYTCWIKKPYKNPHSVNREYKAGVIILNDQNQFILVQNWGRKWTFPKGSIEPNETSEEAAARELYEETGIEINPKYLRIYYEYSKKSQYFICNANLCDNYREDKIRCKSEITGIGWFCFEHLADLNLTMPTRKILQMLSDDIKMMAPQETRD